MNHVSAQSINPEIDKWLKEKPERVREIAYYMLMGANRFTVDGRTFTTNKTDATIYMGSKYLNEKSNIPSEGRRGSALLRNMHRFGKAVLRALRIRPRSSN